MSLVHHWPLQEDSGQTAVDIRSGNDGSNQSAVPGKAGLLGATAYQFDGSSQGVEITGVSQHSSATISCWAYQSTGQEPTRVVYLGQNYGPWVIHVPKSDGRFGSFIKTGGSFTAVSTDGLPTAEWYHVVATINLGGELRLYLNGKPVDSKAINTTHNTQGQGDSIGWDIEDGGRYFNGKIASVRVYDHALSLQSIQALYYGGTGTGALTTDVRTL